MSRRSIKAGLNYNELLNFYANNNIDYIKISFQDDFGDTIISILSIVNGRLYTSAFKKIKGGGPIKLFHLLHNSIPYCKTFDEYIAAIDTFYKSIDMHYDIKKFIFNNKKNIMHYDELIDLYNHNYINYVEHSFTNDSGIKCVEIVAASSDDSDGVRSVIFSRDNEADKWRQISDLEYASFEQYYIINISNKNAVDYKFKKYILCKRRKFDIYKFAKFINYNSDYYDNITNYSYMICDYGKAIEELNADKEDHHLTDDERKQYQKSIDKGIVIYNCCGDEFVGYAKKNGGILWNLMN